MVIQESFGLRVHDNDGQRYATKFDEFGEKDETECISTLILLMTGFLEEERRHH